MEQKDWAEAEFERSPDGPRKVFLRKQTILVEEGFGKAVSTYPVTIVPARYGGTYEYAAWLAFPVDPAVLNADAWQGWDDSDVECAEWHARSREEGWPVGRGAAPDLAYQDLIVRAAEKAGINLASWNASPTWDKNELKRRDE